jgi:hypothetical protein
MGQYYKPVILAKNKKTVIKWMYSHDFDNGLKLMEHSWIGNNFVRAFESLIYRNPQIVVWGGDYAKPCSGRKTNTYGRCNDKNNVGSELIAYEKDWQFIINHTKKLFVDTTKVPRITAEWVGDSDYRIHPLPLLTSDGNGSGGGDFRGNDPNKLVGSWARHLISADDTVPKGYKEIEFNLIEA